METCFKRHSPTGFDNVYVLTQAAAAKTTIEQIYIFLFALVVLRVLHLFSFDKYSAACQKAFEGP